MHEVELYQLDQVEADDTARSEEIDEKWLLGVLSSQREAAIGFDQDRDLNDDRERALDYYRGLHQGQVAKDLPVKQDNRSKVVTTDVADAIETALPDLIEIIAQDGVLEFPGYGPEDEKLAQQETDYVRHVIWEQNDGFSVFYDAIKDALLSKTGVFKYYWDGAAEYEEEDGVVTEAQLEQMMAMGLDVVEYDSTGETTLDGPLYSVTIRKMIKDGRVVIEAVPPEDFAVASNTVKLKDAHYAAHKTRPLVQDLIRDGHDPEKVNQLQSEEIADSESQSRDFSGEHDLTPASHDDGLRRVEVVEHYIRLDPDETGDPQIWRVVTGNDESVVLSMEKRSRIEFAAICPYPLPHRFYGQSLADKVIGTQKWKTSFTRLMNDSVAFSVYQRHEIAKDQIVPKQTLEQFSKNEPGRPVITQKGSGIRPIPTEKPSFDLLRGLEYINTVTEQSTGVVRAAQGLNADSLHKTASGADMLVGAAQKRQRMMARQMVETGIRDLYLGVHDLLRSNATMADTIRLRGNWENVDPTSWRRRADVRVDIGLGSGGRDHDLARFREYWQQVISPTYQMQQGWNGPFMSEAEFYKAAAIYGDKLGVKNHDAIYLDPSRQRQMQPQDPGQQQPDMGQQAHAAKVKADIQKDQQELQMKGQSKVMEIMQKDKASVRKAQTEKYKIDTEAQLAREQMATEARLEEQGQMLEASKKANISDVRFGGEVG